MATKPTKESAETSTTTIQISRGLSACHGPYPRSGRRGSTITVITASSSAALISSVVSAFENASRRGFPTSSTASATPAAPATTSWPAPASAPRRKVASAAISVVAPIRPCAEVRT